MSHVLNGLRSSSELQDVIASAMRKINAIDENQLCYYLPGPKGRLHHWGLKRMKKSDPQHLLNLLREYVLEKDVPEQLLQKRVKKSTNGSDVKSIEVKFKKSEINRLAEVLKNSGDLDLLALFVPYQSFSQVQKLMIEMIREKRADEGLWATYLQLVKEANDMAMQSSEK